MTETQNATRLIFSVDPARLNFGSWCHVTGKTLREGDIAASYSADRIGTQQPVRAPFLWQGARWLCVALQSSRGVASVEAYRVVDARAFAGEPVTYSQRVAAGEEARSDTNGFYHGMTITYAGKKHVLCGPPAHFEAGAAEQLDLFG